MAVMRARDVYRYSIFSAIFALMAVFLIWPIVLTVSSGFLTPKGEFTFAYIASVFSDRLWMEGLGNSLCIAAAVTLVCLVITMPLALLATRFDFPGKALLGSLTLVPLILPPFVGAIGVRAMFGRFGAVNTLLGRIGILDPNMPGIDFFGDDIPGGRFWGIIFLEALHLYPILYLNTTAALANLDPALDEAAVGLGAGRVRRFLGITFPLILPGVFAGATIVFISAFTELGTPLMFDFYTVTPVHIFRGVQEAAANPRPYALVVVMLTVAVGLYLLGKYAFGGRAYAMQSKAAVASTTRKLTGVTGLLASLAFIVVIGVAVLPHIGLILSSFTDDGAWYRSVLPSHFTAAHYRTALAHPLAMGSIRNSLTYASIAMCVSVVVGLAISYLVVRVRVRGAWLLDSLAMLPLAVPGLVMAFGYVAMTLSWPFPQIAKFLQTNGWETLASLLQVTGNNPNPMLILVIAYGIRRLPYVVRSASAGLEQTSGQLEEAALNLGASTFTAIRRIIVPLIMANLIAGGILAFSFAMLEVSDSLILAQKEEHFPITKAIYEFFGRLGDGPYIASAMGVWAMALLTVTLVGAGLMLGKRMGAIFRA